MATAIDAALLKFHASLNVTDLDKSVAFYRVLLGAEPAKVRELRQVRPRRAAAGPVADSRPARCRRQPQPRRPARPHRRGAGRDPAPPRGGRHADRARGRRRVLLRAADQVLDHRSRRALWEIYVFHEDIAEHGDTARTAASCGACRTIASPRGPIRLLRRRRMAAPAERADSRALPADDGTLHEVQLEGAINATPARRTATPSSPTIRARCVPARLLHVHGLAGDRTLGVAPVAAGSGSRRPARAVDGRRRRASWCSPASSTCRSKSSRQTAVRRWTACRCARCG